MIFNWFHLGGMATPVMIKCFCKIDFWWWI